MPNPTASRFLFPVGMGDVPRGGESTDGAGPETGGSSVDTSVLTSAAGASMPLNPAPAVNMTVALPTDTPDFLQNFVNWWENELAAIQQWWAGQSTGLNYTPDQTQQAIARTQAAIGSGVNNPMFMAPVYSTAVPFTTSPGTGTVVAPAAARGVGQYIPTQSYLMSSAGQAGIRGLGGCGCGCSGDCNGMGTLGDGTGLLGSGLFNGNGVAGSGLFESGFDPSTWGPAEWAVVALGGYVAWSVFFTTKAGIGYASTVPARTKRAARSVKSSFL